MTIKRDELEINLNLNARAAQHLLERAPADLRMGWKAWIAVHGYGKEGAGCSLRRETHTLTDSDDRPSDPDRVNLASGQPERPAWSNLKLRVRVRRRGLQSPRAPPLWPPEDLARETRSRKQVTV